jgi:nitrite reductase/ring-hydroxylating ferredoxin subunit
VIGRPARHPSGRIVWLLGAKVPVITDPVLVDDWHPVVTSEELVARRVVGARLLGEDIVVWQADGRALAWQDLCVHRGTRLSLGRVDGGTLQCPYHGWVYGADGQCLRIPALPDAPPPRKARVKTYRALGRYGLVWVSLGEPAHDAPPFPEWDDGGFRKLLCGRRERPPDRRELSRRRALPVRARERPGHARTSRDRRPSGGDQR